MGATRFGDVAAEAGVDGTQRPFPDSMAVWVDVNRTGGSIGSRANDGRMDVVVANMTPAVPR